VTDHEQERFESELRRMAPARPPAELLKRMREPKPALQPASQPDTASLAGWFFRTARMRWLMAATPVLIAALVFVRLESRPVAVPGKLGSAGSPGIKANDVQVDHALVTSFDAVAELPGGEPVRFRCRKWMDQVVMTDSSHGLVVQQSSPRVEVVPVRFETY